MSIITFTYPNLLNSVHPSTSTLTPTLNTHQRLQTFYNMDCHTLSTLLSVHYMGTKIGNKTKKYLSYPQPLRRVQSHFQPELNIYAEINIVFRIIHGNILKMLNHIKRLRVMTGVLLYIIIQLPLNKHFQLLFAIFLTFS